MLQAEQLVTTRFLVLPKPPVNFLDPSPQGEQFILRRDHRIELGLRALGNERRSLQHLGDARAESLRQLLLRFGGELTPDEQAFFDETTAVRRLHRTMVKKPMNLMTRRLFPRALGKLPTDTDP